MVTSLRLLLPIKLPELLVKWYCKIRWQTKTVISPLLHCLWPRNVAGWWLTMRGSQSYRQMTLWSHPLARSCDKKKSLYHFHIPYSHRTWKYGDLTYVAPNQWSYPKFWPRGLTTSRDKVKPVYLHYCNPQSYETWQDDDLPWGAPTQKSHNPWSRCLVRSSDKLKPLCIHYHNGYD